MANAVARRAAGAVMAAAMIAGMAAMALADPNSAPNPYHPVEHWAKLPEGRGFGQVIGVKIDGDGRSVWAFERCGANSCAGSNVAPILEFDPSGKLVQSFGAGMIVFPHGLFIDKGGNVWVTDANGKNGKGQQVLKFSHDGRLLQALGKAGIAGEGPDTFNQPTAVVVAANGDLFVADGHGNSRIVKLGADGHFITAWGKHGSGRGEFATPHGLALDAQGRLFVADRENNRIQIFDQDGKFIAEWRQFGRPSDVFIDKHDTLYVTDSQSNDTTNPGFKRGIRIGSAKDCTVTAFIPDPTPYDPKATGIGTGSGAEGVAADDDGNVFGGETDGKALKKYAKN